MNQAKLKEQLLEDYVLLKKSSPSSSRVSADAGDEKKGSQEQLTPSVSQRALTTSLGFMSKRTGLTDRGINAAALPPAMESVIFTSVFRRRFLARSASVTEYFVTGNSLAGALGSTCFVANTTARAWFSHARIVAVEAWPSQDASATANVVDVRWNSSPLGARVFKPSNVISNLPLGISVTRGLRFVPPRQTVSGDWMNLGSIGVEQMISITASEGSIVDIIVEAAVVNNATGATVTFSGVTAAVGTTGYSPLNGSGGDLIPAGAEQLF
jgi:hypothetical protein